MTRPLACALLSLVLMATGCASSTPPGGSPGWSEAGRRARARHAWRCEQQAKPSGESSRGTVRATRRRRDPSCDPARFLCVEIHRGAQATAAARSECAGYEAVHGRVSDR